MFLKWTVVPAAHGGAGVDIAVEAPPGTTWVEVRDRVLTVAECDGRLATVAGIELGDQHVVGRFPLLDGAEIVVSPAQWRTSGPPAGTRTAVPASAPVTLVAVSGPDAGRELQLWPGRLVLGRGEHCDLVVGDPDVSRRHCQIELSPAGVVVRDLSSTNGTLVTEPRDPSAGQPVGAWAPRDSRGATVALGGHITVGSSRLQVRLHNGADPDTSSADRGDGTVVHAPAPRPILTEPPRVYTVPALATIAPRRRIPWLAAAVPLLVSIPIALWWGSPIFLLVGVAGPLILIGSVVGDRRESRRNHAAAIVEHDLAVASVAAAAARTAADMLAARLHSHPDAASLLETALRRGPALWARTRYDQDALLTRVGVADIEAPIRVDTADASAPSRSRSEHIVMANAPVTVHLTGGVAIQGPAPWREGITRGIVGRVAASVGPDHVRIVVIAGTRQAAHRWRWTRWLPHTDAGAVAPGTADSVERALGELSETGQAGHGNPRLTLVVIDDAPHSAVSRLSALADHATADDSPMAVLVSAAPDRGVPRSCRTRLLPAGESGTGIAVTTPEGSVTGVADHVGAWWAHRLARALAPVRPAVVSTSLGLPDTVSLISLLRGNDGTGPGQAPPDSTDTSAVTASEIAGWWRTAEQSPEPALAVPLAVSAAGPVVVDLVRDGPHALIAGTTGAGKSELLRSLVLGLACLNPPSEVSFLLVDFKGGATLADCARLPHSLGLLTDLDVHEARRVLAGLQAEIRRRERLLAVAGVGDLSSYRGLRRNEPLPRLVCVVDEFRVLAEHAPDVLEALVHVAAVGRSLGVHLILATQRPSGVVSAEIRANTALRIALRVQDAGDSRDVIDRPDASDLPRFRPGRAIISRDGVIETVQTAHAGGSNPKAAVQLRVRRLAAVGAEADDHVGAGDRHGSDGRPDGQASGSTAGDGSAPDADTVTAVIDACRSAATTTSSTAARPWLAPLPAVVSRRDVVDAVRASETTVLDTGGPSSAPNTRSPLVTAPPVAGPGPVLPLALADLPDEQRRSGLCWAPRADGPLVILGGPGSGRTTALAVAVAGGIDAGLSAVVMTGRPEDVWPSGSAVVDWRDADQLDDVLTQLVGRAGAEGGEWMVVAVDDCDGLLQTCGDRPNTVDLLTTVSRDAVAGRLALVLAGGRSLGTARMGTGGRMRVLLRPADPFDASLVGASPRDLPATWPPGRGVVSGGELATGPGRGTGHPGGLSPTLPAVEIQVISPGLNEAPPDDPAMSSMPPGLPTALPRTVHADDLPAPTWPTLSIGLTGPDTRPVSVDVTASPGIVVAGPPGAGRTTTLRLLAATAARCQAAVVVIAPRVDEWDDLASAPRLPDPSRTPGPGSITVVTDALTARSVLAGAGRGLLVIDDLDVCPAEIDDLATAMARAMVPGRGVGTSGVEPSAFGLVVASTSTHLGSQFRGFAAEVRRHGSAVLLRPGRHDARDVLAATAPAQSATMPGRGVLVSRGRAQRVQVASGGMPSRVERPTTARLQRSPGRQSGPAA